MKFIANRLRMLKAVKMVLKVVSRNNDFPEIGGVLIEANADTGILTFSGTDIRTSIQCRLKEEHIEESGSIVFKPVLANILDLLAGETVTFQNDGNCVNLYSGNTVYNIPCLDGKNFPKFHIPFPEDTIQIKGVNSLIKRTVFAADSNFVDKTKPSFSFVKLNFEGGITKAQATDGKCMAITTLSNCADGNLEMIVHEKALQILCSIVNPNEELYVGTVDKFAVFMKEDMFFSTMLFTGHYLDLNAVVQKINPIYSATVDASALYNLLDNVSSVFSVGDDQCVNLCLESDTLCMKTKTATCASVSEISVLNSTPTPQDGFNYLPKLLRGCLNHMSGMIKIGIDRNGFIQFEGDDNLYFVCPRGPVRIVDKNAKKKTKQTKSKTTKLKSAVAKAA